MVQAQGGGGGGQAPSRANGLPIPGVLPLDEITALVKSLGGGSNGGQAFSALPQMPDVDYAAQASQVYAPQFSYLDKLAADSKQRAEGAQKDVGALYDSLVRSIMGQEGGIKQNYDQGINSVGQAYNQALGATNSQFDSTRSNSAEVLKRLGIEQAGENVVGKSNQMQQLLSGILTANGMSTQNAMRQGKSAAVNYNTAQGGAAKVAGTEAKSGIVKQLSAFLDQISGKRADLQSKQTETQFGMQADAQKSAVDSARDQYKQMIDQRDFDYRMAKDKADLDFRANNASQVGGNSVKMDPVGNAQQLALSLYGNQQSAGNAMDAITSAMMQASQGGEKPSLGQLLSVLKSRLQGANGNQIGDWNHLQRLAAMMYDQ